MNGRSSPVYILEIKNYRGEEIADTQKKYAYILVYHYINSKKQVIRGASLAQVRHVTLDFGVLSLSPMLCKEIT